MQNTSLYALLYFTGSLLIALILSILLCRYRIARGKKSFYLTALNSAFISNAVFFFIVFFIGRIYAEGWHVFTISAWKGMYNFSSIMLDAGICILVGMCTCLLPVLVVAYFYDRQNRKNEIKP
jgi:hypothetical protein